MIKLRIPNGYKLTIFEKNKKPKLPKLKGQPLGLLLALTHAKNQGEDVVIIPTASGTPIGLLLALTRATDGSGDNISIPPSLQGQPLGILLSVTRAN